MVIKQERPAQKRSLGLRRDPPVGRVFGEPMKRVEPGTYRHHSGELFTVLHTGLDTVTKEECVIYRPISVEQRIYIAPLNKFLAAVPVSGKREVPRFERIEESSTRRAVAR